MKYFRSAFIFLCLILGFPLYSLSAPASSLVPLDSWVYPALDKLAGLGFIETSLQGTRPYTRQEAARQVLEAETSVENVLPPSVVSELLERLEDELSDALAEARGDRATGGYCQPLRQLSLSYIYQNGQPSTYPRTNARQFALNTNNNGIDYTEGSNGEVRFLGDARIGSFLQFEWQPLLLSSSDDTLEADLLQGRVALSLGAWELSAGRQALWWGPGRHGSLLLTDNAKPLDMLRITNPVPITLPWILKYLGPFRLDAFLSQLEKDRVVPQPYFSGARVNFKPVPWFEFGATRTIIYGGEGRPSVDVSDFVTIFFGETRFGDDDNSNSLASLDWRIKIPWLWQAELYGELGGEDQYKHFFTKKALFLGLYLPILEPSHRLGFRFESADLGYSMGSSQGNGPVWYRHGIYQSGYTYENHILGHHVTGDSRDFYGALEWYPASRLSLVLSCDIEQRGKSQPVEEKHFQPGIQARWQATDNMALKGQFFYDWVKNPDFVAGEETEQSFASLTWSYSW